MLEGKRRADNSQSVHESKRFKGNNSNSDENNNGNATEISELNECKTQNLETSVQKECDNNKLDLSEDESEELDLSEDESDEQDLSEDEHNSSNEEENESNSSDTDETKSNLSDESEQDNNEKPEVSKEFFDLFPQIESDTHDPFTSCMSVDAPKITNKKQHDNYLDHYRAVNGNVNYPCRLRVVFVLYHKSKKMLIVGGAEGSLTFFNVNGETNTRIHSLLYERFPLKGGILVDDENIACFSKFNSYNVYNLNTMKTTKFSVGGRQDSIISMASPPNKRYLLVGTIKHFVYHVDRRTMHMTEKIFVDGKPVAMSFSHGGKYMYIATDFGVHHIVESTDNYKTIIKKKWVEQGYVSTNVAISPNDEFLISSTKSSCVNMYLLKDIWNSSLKVSPIPNHQISLAEKTNVNILRFSSDGKLLVIGSTFLESSIRIFNMETRQLYRNFNGNLIGKVMPMCVDFSLENRYLAVGLYNGHVATFVFNDYPNY